MMRPLFLWSLALVQALGVSPVRAENSAASEPLAEVDGEVITAEQVEKAGGAPLAKLHKQMLRSSSASSLKR